MKRLVPFILVLIIPLCFTLQTTGQDLFPTSPIKPSGEIITKETKDWAMLWNNNFHLYNNVFNKGIVFRPYKQSIFLEKLDGRTVPGWMWDWQMCSDIASYPSIVYGNTPWVYLKEIPELPMRVGTKHLKADFDISMKAQGVCRLTYLMYVISSLPSSYKKITHVIFVVIDNHNMMSYGNWLGVVKNGGRQFDVNSSYYILRDGPDGQICYTEFVARRPMLKGSLDMTTFTNFLVKRKLMKPGSYITNIELGTHVMGGSGLVEIKDLSYSFQ